MRYADNHGEALIKEIALSHDVTINQVLKVELARFLVTMKARNPLSMAEFEARGMAPVFEHLTQMGMDPTVFAEFLHDDLTTAKLMSALMSSGLGPAVNDLLQKHWALRRLDKDSLYLSDAPAQAICTGQPAMIFNLTPRIAVCVCDDPYLLRNLVRINSALFIKMANIQALAYAGICYAPYKTESRFVKDHLGWRLKSNGSDIADRIRREFHIQLVEQFLR